MRPKTQPLVILNVKQEALHRIFNYKECDVQIFEQETKSDDADKKISYKLVTAAEKAAQTWSTIHNEEERDVKTMSQETWSKNQ